MIWTACKRTHNQYETDCGFRHRVVEEINEQVMLIGMVNLNEEPDKVSLHDGDNWFR